MILLFDLIVDARIVYSQHFFVVGKTRREIHVTLNPNIELKRQGPSKIPLHLKQKLEKPLIQLKGDNIFCEMGDDDGMGSLFFNLIILLPKKEYVWMLSLTHTNLTPKRISLIVPGP